MMGVTTPSNGLYTFPSALTPMMDTPSTSALMSWMPQGWPMSPKQPTLAAIHSPMTPDSGNSSAGSSRTPSQLTPTTDAFAFVNGAIGTPKSPMIYAPRFDELSTPLKKRKSHDGSPIGIDLNERTPSPIPRVNSETNKV